MFNAPPLPAARGAISEAVLDALRVRPDVPIQLPVITGSAVDDDDLHLALYCCYELHYRGFHNVDAAWEWSPALLAARRQLEEAFLRSLYDQVGCPGAVAPADVAPGLRRLIAESDGPSLSSWVEERATLAHLQELAIHRSAYQLKEADPHTWSIPRLPSGRAKVALVRLQADEYGSGIPGQSHAELFAETMTSLGLDATYGRFIDLLPGITLATVNLLSMFGLHRDLAPACIGHLAVFEMTSVEPMTRYAAAHRRVTGSEDGTRFYDVHVVADVEHAQIAINDLVPGLIDADPTVGGGILFGAVAITELERRFAEHVLSAWQASESSLRLEADAALLAS